MSQREKDGGEGRGEGEGGGEGKRGNGKEGRVEMMCRKEGVVGGGGRKQWGGVERRGV